MNFFSKPSSPVEIPKKYITPISYNGLSGRIVHIPSKGRSKKPLVLIAGMHSAHERMYSFGSFFARYGDVYMIDVPGFGGMDSFNKIGRPIDFDSYAEYIYGVLKTRKLTKDVTIFAISIGSLYVTRMLQMLPECQSWFSRYIAFVGFTKRADFNLSILQKLSFAPLGLMAKASWLIRIIEVLFFNRIMLKPFMWLFAKTKTKMQAESQELLKQNIQMETYLWHANDLRTYAQTIANTNKVDIRTGSNNLITVPFHNITTANDQYFDQKEVNKGFRDIFADITLHEASLGVHMPSIVDGEDAVERIFDPHIIDDIMNVKKTKSRKKDSK